MSSQLSAQWTEPLWGAEPRFELGPALELASALSTEPRCTLTDPRCTLLMRAQIRIQLFSLMRSWFRWILYFSSYDISLFSGHRGLPDRERGAAALPAPHAPPPRPARHQEARLSQLCPW
jgi:hypothetical protein